MLMIPAMAKRGYNVGYAAAATATAGGIGIIIPPSIPMVIYGVSGQQSISKMFMAGIIRASSSPSASASCTSSCAGTSKRKGWTGP